MHWKSFTNRLLLGLVIASGTVVANPICREASAQNYVELAPAISQQEAGRLAKERSRAFRGEADLKPILESYSKYLIPRLTQGSIPNQGAINMIRTAVLQDIDAASKNQNVGKEFNAELRKMLQPIVENKPLVGLRSEDVNLKQGEEYYPASRINAMIMLLAMNESPAVGLKPPVPEKGMQQLINNLLKEPKLDAITYLALQGVQKQVRVDVAVAKGAEASAPARHVTEAGRAAFVQSITNLLDAPQPVFRTAPAQEKLREQCLVTLTMIASTSVAEAPSGVKAAEQILKQVTEILNDETTSEWIKETACRSLGVVSFEQQSEEQVEKLYKAFAKYGIKSIKDWRVRVASSTGLSSGGMGAGGGYPGGGMGGMGGGPGSGYGGGPGGGESGGGYPGGMGGGAGASQPRQSQPVEVKNARRLAHQRFEALHLAANGKSRKWPANHPMLKVQDKELGLAAMLKGNQTQAPLLAELIEKIELCQEKLGDEKLMSLAELTGSIRKPIAELRVAFELFSGEREKEDLGAGIELDE
ncbi:hypothetical protein SH449x_000926 [Pirellulaceae bacterium SH449]